MQSEPSCARQLRQQTLEQLYLSLYPELQNAAYTIYPQLMVFDCDRILEELAAKLRSYRGALTQTAFERWAVKFVRKRAGQYQFISQLKQECRSSVRAAIRRKIGSTNEFDDDAAVIDDLEDDVWSWVMDPENLAALAVPGTASLKTRLYGRAAWTARAWLTKQIRQRDIVRRRVHEGESLGVAFLSQLELDSIRADELADAA